MVITSRKACEALDEVAQPNFSSEGRLGWLERNGLTNGATQLFVETDHGAKLAIPKNHSVGSRVNGYGGRSWCWAKNRLVYVNAKDQQLYLTDTAFLKSEAITNTDNKRFIEPSYSERLNAILAICETHKNEGVTHSIVMLDFDDHGLIELDASHDFYAGITLSTQNDSIAWVSWNHPAMPWTNTHLETATLTANGLIDKFTIAGQSRAEALTQPRYDVQGQLWVVSDRSGYWNLYSVNPIDKELVAKGPQESDCVSSPWQGGLIQYLPDSLYGPVYLNYKPDKIRIISPRKIDLTPEINHVRELASFGPRLVMVAAGAKLSVHLLEQDLSSGAKKQLRPTHLKPADVTIPQVISIQVGEDTVSGFYFAPKTISKLPPPLLMNLHGGPTSSAYPIYSPQVEYWTSRGFAIFDLNYRGSSNLGREYRFKLKEAWGVSDVEDIKATRRALIDQSLADPKNTFIRGRSSGGFSALMALCEGIEFSAATSYFGVTDPLKLRSKTHKFESHYIDWLIGDTRNHAIRYEQRSPVKRAHQISTPVLFLQGSLDNVVTPDQTEHMHLELLKRHIETDMHVFKNEGHGFRDIEVQSYCLELETEFYNRFLT